VTPIGAVLPSVRHRELVAHGRELDALGFDALARIYALQSPALVAARGLGVRLLDRLAPLKRRLAEHAAGL